MRRFRVFLLALTLAVSAASANAGEAPIQDDLLTVPGVAFETYLARWWGIPGSVMTRPIYRMARFDTDGVQVHYGIMPGRELADYTMPYWPIRSFLSIVDPPAELSEQAALSYRDAAGSHTKGFVPRSGVELAAKGNTLLVKARNRSLAAPEDVTAAQGETLPLSLEQVLFLRKGSGDVHVQCTLTNTGDAALTEVSALLTFEQSFGWTRFGAAEEEGAYGPLAAPASGAAQAFYAWSEGMERGYAFTSGTGAELEYELFPEMNRWQVRVCCTAGGLAPGGHKVFTFGLSALRSVPERAGGPAPALDLSHFTFTRLQPAAFKTAPVLPEKRVSLAGMLANLDRPKVRGLNLRANPSQALNDLETLKAWGGNLVIAGLGGPEHTAELMVRGHALGMEMLLAGHGSYMEGPPKFDAYYAAPRTADQLPDAHGQDEDHYYWYAIEPALDFETTFGKPMAQATHEDRVACWAKCFAEKWRGVREGVRPHAPDAGIWFYAPFPGVAHVDPLDSYGLFLRTMVEELGPGLTVFPFYYGVEFNQAEYMMARWKEAGAARAVFLPMRDFMTQPSQFIRAVTASRRGGADGTCGFNFGVSAAPPEQQWQWKAVMLAAWANFPTPELNAYSLLEEPAELVEALAQDGLAVRVVDEAQEFDGGAYLAPLFETLPNAHPARAEEHGLTIIIAQDPLPPSAESPSPPPALWAAHKGFVQMEGKTVVVSGANARAIESACGLLLRFAEVARDEAGRAGSG